MIEYLDNVTESSSVLFLLTLTPTPPPHEYLLILLFNSEDFFVATANMMRNSRSISRLYPDNQILTGQHSYICNLLLCDFFSPYHRMHLGVTIVSGVVFSDNDHVDSKSECFISTQTPAETTEEQTDTVKEITKSKYFH